MEGLGKFQTPIAIGIHTESWNYFLGMGKAKFDIYYVVNPFIGLQLLQTRLHQFGRKTLQGSKMSEIIY